MTTRLSVLCSSLLTLNTPLAATASGSNALDRIDFGDSASEKAHQFDPGTAPGDMPAGGIGALGQTYRAPNEVGDMPAGKQLVRFTLTLNPTNQNYLTVRL